MSETSVFDCFPKLQIKPYDGMPVTADVWAEAHQEHRLARQAHDLVFHGAGIICGLEVVANDPADQYVFILPGVAVDPTGQVIALNEPIAYDFGNATEGELYLLLGHGEREVSDAQKDVRHLQSEYVIAARPALSRRPAVELARVKLVQRGNPIKNAINAAHPGVEEIDMRYRIVVGPQTKQLVKVAVCALGKDTPADMVAGWDYLARECQRSQPYQVVTETGLSLSPDLMNYTLVYLTGSGSFQVDSTAQKALKAFIDNGRMAFIEALDAAAEESFKPLLSTLGAGLKPLAENDALLKFPYLFNAPPEGNSGNKVQVGKGVIYSTAKYALAWSGKVGSSGSRSDIRSAHEWGMNLVHYCAQ